MDNNGFSLSQVDILKTNKQKISFTLERWECILVRNKGKDTLAFFFPLNFTTLFSVAKKEA